MINGMEKGVWHLNFRTGEARLVPADEHALVVAEIAKRTTIKDGVVYVDCEPPKS